MLYMTRWCRCTFLLFISALTTPLFLLRINHFFPLLRYIWSEVPRPTCPEAHPTRRRPATMSSPRER